MLILYVISFLYLTQLSLSQTISESEAINKIIGDLLLKTEKKNAGPIKFNWNTKFTTDNQFSTQYYNQWATKRNLDIVNSNLFVRKEARNLFPTKRLQDVEPKKEPRDLQDIIAEINKIYNLHAAKYTSKEDLDRTARTTTKKHELVKVSPKASPYSKTKTTTPMAKQANTTKQKENIANNDSNYLITKLKPMNKTKQYTKPLHNDAIYYTMPWTAHERQFSESIFKIIKEHSKTYLTTTPKMKETSAITTTSTEHIKNPQTIISSSSTIEVKNNTSNINQDLPKYEHYYITDDKSFIPITVNTDPEQTFTPKPTTTKDELDSIEEIVNSIPNYKQRTTESLADFIKRFLLSKVHLEDSIEYKQNMKPTIAMDLNDAFMKRASGQPLIETKQPVLVSNSQETTTRMMDTSNKNKETFPENISWTSTYKNPAISNVYFLEDHKDNALKSYLTLKSQTDKSNTLENTNQFGENNMYTKTNSMYTAVTREIDTTTKHNDVTNLFREIFELYTNIKQHEENEVKEHRRTLKKMNWSRIKNFLGHVKANKTTCSALSASDSVIKELEFEFNNLADYMKRHCTEIQTYFWMNPSGGKKLRDSIRKIDKTMSDYYKRAKGKSHKCKHFTPYYLEKREYENKKKIYKMYLEELMRDLGIGEL